jgi:hypothetical protein
MKFIYYSDSSTTNGRHADIMGSWAHHDGLIATPNGNNQYIIHYRFQDVWLFVVCCLLFGFVCQKDCRVIIRVGRGKNDR